MEMFNNLNLQGGGGGGGGGGKARRTGPAPTSESPPPKRDVQQPKHARRSRTGPAATSESPPQKLVVQQPKPVLSPCLNGEPSVPVCTETKEESSCIGSSLQDQTSQLPSSPIVDSRFHQAGVPLPPVHFDSKDRPSKSIGSQRGKTSSDGVASDGNSENSEPSPIAKSFDICLMKKGTTIQLKRPLFDKNRERRKEDACLKDGAQHSSLKPGMVLLKNFLSRSDQIKIVKLCKNLGVGQGGFLKPAYEDGAQLQLMMMCLGKHWHPETGYKRPTDGHVPPDIPAELTMLVKGAIQASHTFLKQKKKGKDPEEVLPSMQPDICIVNFYSNSGKLGLHQDKDETKESLDKGLPVVSFSIGDSAEFLYGDHRDVERAEKVVLESGDVLIFGGMSRHIFHGVKCISPGTAPKTLLDDTNLRPGRLNLTFRKY